jgi:hypothetical protein
MRKNLWELIDTRDVPIFEIVAGAAQEILEQF